MDNKITFPSKMNEVFGLLSTGYHLCIEDGEAYKNLTDNEIFYREMFELLGFNLSDGSDALYYFLPSDEKVTKKSKLYIVFMGIMYDWLADQGREPASSLTEDHFYIDQLPHLSIDQYKKTMRQLDVTDEQSLLKIVQELNRYGFLDLIDNSMIKFKKTVSRFETIFSDISKSRDRAQDKEGSDE